MINLGHLLTRKAFMDVRMAVYENLHDQMTDISSRRKETFAQAFQRWAERDKRRGELQWKAYAAISKRLEAGEGLALALRPFIPYEEAMMVRAGEDAGRLADVFKAIITQGDVIKQTRRAMVGALAEPAMMLAGFFLMSLFFGWMLWPMFDRQIPSEMWDTWTIPLRAGQVFYAGNWWWITPAILGMVALVYWSRPRWTGRARMFVDNLPPFSIYRDLTAIQCLIVLSALIRAGLTLEASLQKMSVGATPYLKWHLAGMRKRDKSHNGNIVKTFSTGLFSTYIVDRIADAAQGRDLDGVMAHVAQGSLKNISNALASRAKVINATAIALVSLLYIYMTAVQVIGIQNATARFEAAVQQRSQR